jgi:hypothetical protein
VGRKCLALPLLRNGLATGRRTGGQADQFHHKQRRRLGCHNPQLARGPRGNAPKVASTRVVRETV